MQYKISHLLSTKSELYGEAIRENELRRISLCVEIGFESLSKRGNSG